MSETDSSQFDRHVDAFCNDLVVERNASSHTVRNYRIDLEDYGRWALRNGIDPLRVHHRQLRRYLAELDKARYTRATINRRLSAIRAFFRWATIAELLDSNPADALMSLRKDNTLPHRIPHEDMLKILLVNAPRDERGVLRDRTPIQIRDQAILEFLYASGARISEASTLRMSCIDYGSGQVRLFGKGSKERIVPVHTLALEAMRTYQDTARDELLGNKTQSEFFFVSSRGNQMKTDAMRKMFRATVQAAGIQAAYTPHDMRHTFASDVLEGGADLRSVQEMLGHASLSTTQVYTHLSAERLKAVFAQSHPRS